MVKKEKVEKVEALRKRLEKYPVIALIDMYKMPSSQLQEIRKKLRGKAKIEMIKKVILKFALEKFDKEGIKELESHIPTQPALALTDMESFKFFALVDSMRFKTYAKEGDVVGEDVWVYAGPTHLMAGPVISELQQAGVPATIESGRIKIRKNKCVAKKGEAVSAAEANILRKLKIEPMEVVLNVVAIYEDGSIYTKDVLELTKTFPQKLSKAVSNALNLSVFIEFPTKGSISHILAKAVRTANALKSFIGKTNGDEEGTELKTEKVEEKEDEKGDSNDVKGEKGEAKEKQKEIKEDGEHGGAS